jgi:hypothetical protein
LSGAYWDLFSTMVTMGPVQLPGKDRADKAYLLLRTKTKVFDNDLLAAMTHKKASCLYGKESGALSTQKEAFGACPDYNEWIGIGGSELHKATLDQRVTTFCEGVPGTLSGPGGPLALALLSSAQDQFTKVMSGLHKRVGEVKKRDEAMTIDVVHAIQDIWHAIWGKTDDPKQDVALLKWVRG